MNKISKLKIGFIGLGLMGNPMAKNILKSGFDLTVYNRTFSKTKELLNLGAKTVKTPKELAKNCDVAITMVTGPKDVENVLFSNNGVVFGNHKNLIVIDMSTIGPSNAKKISNKLSKYKIEFLDAPVTGSTPKAITGELTIFIGGKAKIYTKVKKVLLAMGKNLHYMGKAGNGQAIKLINNLVLAISINGLGEGMLLADILGLPRKKTAEVLSTVPSMSPMMNLKIPNFVTNKFPLLFSMANMHKDLNLALIEIKKSKKNSPVLEKALELYDKAIKKKLEGEDFSSIIKVIK